MQLLQKTFGILEHLGGAAEALALGDVARAAGIPKPTAYRILRALVKMGYAAQDPSTSRYALTSRLGRLGRGARGPDVRRRALPLMERVHRKFNETVNLAVLEGTDVVYVHVMESTRPFRLMTRPDARDPFHSTSLGRAIAAFLPDEERRELLRRADIRPETSRAVRTREDLERILRKVRERGWAEDREENEPGIVCLGVPLLERGYPAAALSLTLPGARLTPALERSIVSELKAAAGRELPR